jgi:ribonuclease R
MPKARIYPYDEAALEQLGEQCSMTERRADEATRDVVNWLKCEFMKDRVGENFPGVITAVTGFGLFVELTDIYVEGLVHVTAMPGDYYHFDPLHHRLSGERSGRSFRLGDSVEVRVMRVDLDERKIDFELISGGSKIGIGERGSADTKVGARKDGRGKKGADTSPSKEREPVSAEVRKSREMKKALLTDAKGGKDTKGKSTRSSSKPKAASKPPAKSDGSAPRKRKAKT